MTTTMRATTSEFVCYVYVYGLGLRFRFRFRLFTSVYVCLRLRYIATGNWQLATGISYHNPTHLRARPGIRTYVAPRQKICTHYINLYYI